MEKKPAKAMVLFLATGSVITWFAVGLQFYLIILNRVTSLPETVTRFFSYYTILTNILVAFYFTTVLLKPGSRWDNFFARPGAVTAITLYICVVGITYNLILRQLWSPEGLQRLADELLHVVVPLIFIFYWLMFAPKAGLQWKNVFPWLVYPLAYVSFILFRGALSGFYPYPFVDVSVLGYGKVLLNSFGLFFLFLFISLVLVLIASSMNKRRVVNS